MPGLNFEVSKVSEDFSKFSKFSKFSRIFRSFRGFFEVFKSFLVKNFLSWDSASPTESESLFEYQKIFTEKNISPEFGLCLASRASLAPYNKKCILCYVYCIHILIIMNWKQLEFNLGLSVEWISNFFNDLEVGLWRL